MEKIKLLCRSANILYLPIEISSREFHAKLFLAHSAASQGWKVVMGPRFEVSKLAEILPAGVYLGIGFHTSAATIGRKLKKLGHRVISMDEEGLVRLAPEYYREYRVDPRIFDVSENALFWNESHLSEVRELAKGSQKLRVIGNPRLDILMEKARGLFSKDVECIEKSFGEFILVNSSFGTANHMHGIDYWREELRKRGWFDTPEKEEYQNSRIEFQGKIFLEMKELVKAIASEGFRVVIRPHPSEDISGWKNLERDFPNVIFVERKGNVIPWMLAASAIIHNGCTTAIEGRLLGKNVISYRPVNEPLVEAELPNSVGVELFDRQSVVSFLKQARASDLGSQWPELPALDEAEVFPSSVEDNFSKRFVFEINKHSTDPKHLEKKNLFKIWLSVFWTRAKLFLSGIKNRSGRAYEEQKCPPVPARVVQDAISMLDMGFKQTSTSQVVSLTNRSVIISKEME